MSLIWPFRPRFDVSESLEWVTDVIKCKKAEYRRCMTPIPRQHFAYSYNLLPNDYGIAKEIIRAAGVDQIYVPNWTVYQQSASIGAGTVTLAISTSGTVEFFVGGKVLIWESNQKYELCDVTAAAADSLTISATTQAYNSPAIVPARLGHISADLVYEGAATDNLCRVSNAFVITATDDLASFASARPTYPSTAPSYPVIADQTEIINGASQAQTREADILDSRVGPISKYALYATPNQKFFLAWTLQSQAEIFSLRAFLHSMRGSQKTFWVSSRNADVTITKAIGPGDGSIEIVDINMRGRATFPLDMCIEGVDGTLSCFRVVSAAAGSAGKEILTIAGAFSGGAPLASIVKTSKLTYSRFAADRIEFAHLPGRQATVVAPVVEVPIYP